MPDTRSNSDAIETQVSVTPTVTATVTVRYWAAARAAVGLAAEEVPLDDGATLADLRTELTRRHPDAARVLGACSVLVGDRPVGKTDPADVVLPPGSVVELLPPFAGG